MINREYIKMQIDTLPEVTLDRYDTDYLMSVLGMAEIIKDALETPLSECLPLSEII